MGLLHGSSSTRGGREGKAELVVIADIFGLVGKMGRRKMCLDRRENIFDGEEKPVL